MKIPPVEQLKRELEELAVRMSDPAVNRNVSEMKRLSNEHNVKKELLQSVEELTRAQQQQEETTALADSEEEELRQLANEDLERLAEEIKHLESKIEDLLIPSDPLDSRDVIIELRAGAGGEEAALFASELFRSYSRYAERQGWKMHIVNKSLSEQHGFKEVIAEISGSDVFGVMKYERGVHRVQRVPTTEKMGRVHTSTVTVAVLPQAEDIDMIIKPEDLRIDTYRAGGAGGQHVNKTSSAVRITHVPSGTVVAVQNERSQHKNKEKAMSILRARLLEAEETKRQSTTASERRQQVGTGDRSEKIRTFNYPQDRITDHRIKESWSNIPAVMEGEWDDIFNALRQADRELRLKQAFHPV